MRNDGNSKDHFGSQLACEKHTAIGYRMQNQRQDGIVINKNHHTLYILQFRRSSDRNEDFLRAKQDEANKQHKNIIKALEADVPD